MPGAGRRGTTAGLSQALARLGVRLAGSRPARPELNGRTSTTTGSKSNPAIRPAAFSFSPTASTANKSPAGSPTPTPPSTTHPGEPAPRSMYTGQIQSTGRVLSLGRDKVVRFADKERHQLFLEPKAAYAGVYVNGLATSLRETCRTHAPSHSGWSGPRSFATGTRSSTTTSPGATQTLSGNEAGPRSLLAGQINGPRLRRGGGQGSWPGQCGAGPSRKEPLVLRRDQAYLG